MPAWVEWEHVATGMTHCPVCLKLDRCWFTDETKPMLPQHLFCHCQANPLSFSRVLNETEATSAYSKFNPYLFNTKGELEQQALDKYVSGEYKLGKLNDKGQRISIRVEIPRKNKQEKVSFVTGWMVYPNGRIQMTTPYGGD